MLKSLFCSIVLIFLFSCSNSDQEIKDLEEYMGPIQEAINIEILHSDSSVVIIKITAARQLIYLNSNQEYPDGIYIEFYNQDGSLSTTLQGNKGFYDKKEDLYRISGDVKIYNISKNQKLNTEELFWRPQEEKVYTERFVTIETDGEVIKGEGLTANQDFSSYRITKPTGRISIQE